MISQELFGATYIIFYLWRENPRQVCLYGTTQLFFMSECSICAFPGKNPRERSIFAF